MKKKVLSLILVLTMGLAVTACGTKKDDTPEKDAKTETAADEDKDAAEPGSSGEVDMSTLKGKTIGFSQCDNGNSWRIAETESMQAAADKYGVNLIYTDASADIAKQASDIEDMVAQGVDYLIVAPQEEDGLQAALQAAMDKDIPVILVDRSVNGEAGQLYTSQIMSDFIWEAEQCAKIIMETTGEKGNIVILQGTQGATSTNDRQKGFMDAIEGTDMNVVADQVANYVMDEAQDVMANILQAQGDDIDAVYCHNDDMAQGAIAAIKAAGYVPGKDIYVVGIDGPKAAMESILAGEQLASCSCSPLFGEPAFELCARLAGGEKIDASYTNEDTLYTIDNASVDAGF
ncbi:ABC transporter substrate-binding protein [Faecalicatena contorta]|uniref:Monosaccharide ABC transporter substrate-binding protein, CUT2 family n=1 Tax=Faecalicatena contorta TaxID=39482 RepID=A0A315ZV82_9FIRM|nr:ABC transporter substrate-binding protein [Faecalicatena contorta]PWJ49209.1 monosaccharide ABC transporter substrate-binding protein (CUT2 family) [Faecalicatena contorta]SUQ14914.1 monosaccharide ABC transporter substrate-binding protein, CUT2 family [Faecalicatena contorta]